MAGITKSVLKTNTEKLLCWSLFFPIKFQASDVKLN